MRRSSKASHLISQSGQDQTYKFRCMEYLNFVLDQVVNQQNRFKLYSSHIEHLLRNNLNDITIQDIEKIKRMLDEGERQKIQTQQTGEFINYDLIDKQKYSHPHTHYYLQQAPKQSLLQYYGTNDFTLQQVQQIKNKNRQQRLYETNYKMLDLMFKLPQDYQKLQDQLEKQLEKQQNNIDGQIENQQLIGKGNDINVINDHHMGNDKSKEGLKFTDIIINADKQSMGLQNANVQQSAGHFDSMQKQSNGNVLLSEKSKPQNSSLPEIHFVQIKKKKSTKKKSVINNEQKTMNGEKNNQNSIKPQGSSNQNKAEIQNNFLQQDQYDENGMIISPQKRKYIRKKPMEPKKPKPEKQKILSDSKSEKKGHMVQGNGEIKQLTSPKNEIIQKQKEKKPKKPKKPQIIQNSPQQIKKQTPKSLEQIQIMVAYPGCEKQVDELKREIEEFKKTIQDQRMQFQQNRQHALTIIQKAQCIQKGKNNYEKHEMEAKLKQSIIDLNSLSKQNLLISKNQQIIDIVEPYQQLQGNQQKQQKLITYEQRKKQKSTTKLSVLKKQSKKSSSQSYKPLQDQQQSSISENENNPKLTLEDQQSDHKKQKPKKKYTKKKNNKQLSIMQKHQNINLSQSVNPSIQNQSQTNKQKKAKLTNQQRQKLKLQRQKLKQMKQKQKQQKKKLKQLQKLQKQTLKLTQKMSQKSQKSKKQTQKLNKLQKKLSKAQKNLLSMSRSNTSSVGVNNSQMISDLISENYEKASQDNEKNVISHQQLLKLGEKQKHSLNQSIGNNSTKQDIKMDSISFEKKQISREQQPSGSKKLYQNQFVQISSILNPSLIQQNNQQNETHQQEYRKRNSPLLSSIPNNELQYDNSLPNKRVKLTCKQSKQYEDPQYGIQNPNQNNKQKYLIQIFNPVQIIPNSPQNFVQQEPKQQIEEIKEPKISGKEFQRENEIENNIQVEQHSSSLSAEDQ